MLLSSFKQKMRMNRKGQFHNYMAVISFVFIFSLITMIAMVMLLAFRVAWTDAGLYTGQMEETGDDFIETLQIYDSLLVLLLSILVVGVIITSYKLNTSPMFFVVTLILGAFFGFVSFLFNYIFIQIVGDSVFSGVLIYFPKMILICTNLHWIALVLIVLGSIALYAKKTEKGGEFVE